MAAQFAVQNFCKTIFCEYHEQISFVNILFPAALDQHSKSLCTFNVIFMHMGTSFNSEGTIDGTCLRSLNNC